MKHRFCRVMRVIVISLGCILALLLLWAVVHQVITASEKKNTVQVGKYVSVAGKQMNVYEVGDGFPTIVLMPGLGTAAPVLDFMPLMDALSAYPYKVVAVEPLGYG